LSEPPRKRGALFSLSDKRGCGAVARALRDRGYLIYATGGTRTYLQQAGVEAHEVAELTGFPALFSGRVKTLHPKIFGAILYDRSDPEHAAQRDTYAIPSLDIVVVNLYPFEATIASDNATLAEAIEQIDIGGVSLLRAAAKNFAQVAVLSDPLQYEAFLAALERDEIPAELRRAWAAAAFERTAEYDAAISHYLAAEGALLPADLPGALTLAMPLRQRLRYGTNPQWRAAFYLDRADRVPEQLHGKELSYNNLLDLDATLRMMARAPIGAAEGAIPGGVRAAVVKHTVPCGVAQRATVVQAVRDALDADSVSAFGGIVAVDAPIDLDAARSLSEFFLEIVAAPAFAEDALALLQKKKSLRVMRYAAGMPEELSRELRVRSALGGVLAEDDDPAAPPETWRVVSARQPDAREWADLAFAWDIVRHVKSNGVVLVRDGVTRGICAGQTNRVSAVRIAGVRAAARAAEAAVGAANVAAASDTVCASDGFFPFADGLEAAADAGCTAVIAPGGSVRDADIISAANARNIALVFSTHRYFLH
jgi:phosphoribosylaminoimidazolecarboxamide formyltransferase/IMP cyclohydrolase